MGLHNPQGFLAMFDRLVPLALEGESPTQADQLASMTAAGMNGILCRMKLKRRLMRLGSLTVFSYVILVS